MPVYNTKSIDFVRVDFKKQKKFHLKELNALISCRSGASQNAVSGNSGVAPCIQTTPGGQQRHLVITMCQATFKCKRKLSYCQRPFHMVMVMWCWPPTKPRQPRRMRINSESKGREKTFTFDDQLSACEGPARAGTFWDCPLRRWYASWG